MFHVSNTSKLTTIKGKFTYRDDTKNEFVLCLHIAHKKKCPIPVLHWSSVI